MEDPPFYNGRAFCFKERVMLILARKLNESIIIDSNIVVSVIDIKGDQIKLGIEAPREVKVFRKEVFDAIQAENRAAARSVLPDLDILKTEKKK